MRKDRCAIVIGALVVSLSCGSNATGPSVGQSNNWWPMDKGNTWTYLEEDGGASQSRTSTILATGVDEPFADNLFLMFTEYFNSSEIPDSTFWQNDSDLLCRWHFDDDGGPGTVFWHQEQFLELPLFVGKTWVFGGSTGIAECISMTQTVIVTAGTFEDCAVIEIENYGFTLYIAKGIGLVLAEEGAWSMQLTSYLVE